MKRFLLTLACALALGAVSVQAGPGPQTSYFPLKSAAEYDALKPGAKIAVTCPSCGAVTTSIIGKQKSHAFDCNVCKHSFDFTPTGAGKTSSGKLICKDPKTGKTMPLHVCAAMHQ